jgi:metal-responsive CopG/Arc/MetJ family transcriptional regulator
MRRIARIGVRIQRSLFRSSEHSRRARRGSSSALIRRAVRELIDAKRRREREKRFVRGYLADPEDAGEVAVEGAVGLAAFALDD